MHPVMERATERDARQNRTMCLYVNCKGRLRELRRQPELLPNGKWRLDFASGLVELRDNSPQLETQERDGVAEINDLLYRESRLGE